MTTCSLCSFFALFPDPFFLIKLYSFRVSNRFCSLTYSQLPSASLEGSLPASVAAFTQMQTLFVLRA
jgi:hypothetical protein